MQLGKFKWDRTTMKEIYKFKNKNFKHNGKKCTVKGCGKRLRHHHYLCDSHWEQKRSRGDYF